MKFGITIPNSGPGVGAEHAARLARLAEDLGFDSLWAVEHVVVPRGYRSVYPYSSKGRMPGGDEIAIADPLVWLAFAAAVTSRITLATGILILPQRNPVILAKETATLDSLSGGRFVLGIGVGWLREEFDALGVPFEDRGARADEYVEVLRALWRDDDPSYAGRYASFQSATMYPKPVRRSIPVVVGGHTDAAARRAGRIGDGFFPYTRKPDVDARLFEIVRASARDAGRDPDSIEFTCGTNVDLDAIRRYADLGVARVVIPPLGADLPTLERTLGEFAETVMSRV